tara:strand:- start:30 stop:1064 length:1035 start_codon:yes stop_codon:yes gene_type:complete
MIFKNYQNILWIFVFLPIFIMMILGFRKRREKLSLFINPKLWPQIIPELSYSRRFWKRFLSILAIIFLVIALMRPQYGLVFKKIQRKGNDIYIAIDTSKSMLVKDVKPSRFEHSKREIYSLIEELKGDRIGLIAFAGDAYIQCPLTVDYASLKLFLDNLEVGSVPVAGTDLATAIKTARTSFEKVGENTNKILIIISDGEGFENDPIKSAEAAAEKDINIYTIGVGTKAGELIPLYDDKGAFKGYKKDKEDKVILSKLDQYTLEQISFETNGKYYSSDLGQFVMDKMYRDISLKETKLLEEELLQMHEDRYQWFLAFTFILLLIETFLGDIHRRTVEWRGRISG